MDKELSHYLTKKYPRIFPQKANRAEFSWGFECNSGWFQLLNNSCLQVQSHIDHNNQQYEQRLFYQNKIDNNELDELPAWVINDYERGETLKIGTYCSQVVAKQIKEKFGTLRFYYDGGDTFCRGVISMAESMSCHVCEECGDEGQSVSKSGYVKVLCKKHAKKDKFIAYSYQHNESLQILMPEGNQEMKIIQAISDSEVIAENKEKQKIHAFKTVHPKVEYWSGSILID